MRYIISSRTTSSLTIQQHYVFGPTERVAQTWTESLSGCPRTPIAALPATSIWRTGAKVVHGKIQRFGRGRLSDVYPLP